MLTNPKKNNRTLLTSVIPKILIAFLVILFMILLLWYFYHGNTKEIAHEEREPVAISDNTIEVPDDTYILETSYNGDKELSPLLFAYPFQKTNAYIMNKKFVSLYPDEKLAALQDRATSIIDSLFSINGKDVAGNYEKYEDEVSTYCSVDNLYSNEIGIQLNTTEYVSDYLKLISDAGLQMDFDIQTDRCLVWEDNAYYVRCFCDFTVYSLDGSVDTTSFFPVQLEEGKSYQAVLDIGITPVTSRITDTFCLSRMDWMYLEEVPINLEPESAGQKDAIIIVK